MANHCQTTISGEDFLELFPSASKMQIQGECSDLLTISVFPVEGRLLFTKKGADRDLLGEKEGCFVRFM